MPQIGGGERADKNTFEITRKIHDTCILCGRKNPSGLKLKFEIQDDGSVKTHFDCPSDMEGYKGYLHGGIIASLLDSAMTNCLFACGVTGLTAEFNIKYKFPVECKKPAEITAKITKAYSPLYLLTAEIAQDARVVVKADAKFMANADLKNQSGKIP